MNFFQKIYYQWFGYDTLNKQLFNSLDTFDLSTSKKILKENKDLVIHSKTLHKWLSLQQKIMNGEYQNLAIKEINLAFEDILSNEKNTIARKTFEDKYKNYSYNISFSEHLVSVKSLNKSKDITFRLKNLSNNCISNANDIFNWLFYEWKFNGFIQYHSDIAEKLYLDISEYNKNYVICQEQIFFVVLTHLLMADINKQKENSVQAQLEKLKENIPKPYAFEEGQPFDFNIVDSLAIPTPAKEALNLLEFIYNEPWIKSISNNTEDGFNIQQILHTHIGRTLYNYLSMPEQFRLSMKNAEGLNMTELLFSNLDKYITLLTNIRENYTTTQAKTLLKKQSVQNKLVNNKINKV